MSVKRTFSGNSYKFIAGMTSRSQSIRQKWCGMPSQTARN